MIPDKVIFDHIEEVAELDAQWAGTIERYIKGEQTKQDYLIMIDIIEFALPKNKILWPEEAEVYVEDGHIVAEAPVLTVEQTV